jgi:SAM-dependent methyltransferase
MVSDYHRGDRSAFLNVWSSTLEMSAMSGATMFRTINEMDQLERLALGHCRGRILDVGAGAGCHSLELQGRGFSVDAVDISPGCVELMQQRGVCNAAHRNLLELDSDRYDTILLLMNGLGIGGTLDGLNLLIQHLDDLLSPGGQILADSTDLRGRFQAQQGDIQEAEEDYFGETDLVMIYKGIRSEPFAWLYVDFNLLGVICRLHGFNCEPLLSRDDGQYLVRITRHKGGRP